MKLAMTCNWQTKAMLFKDASIAQHLIRIYSHMTKWYVYCSMQIIKLKNPSSYRFKLKISTSFYLYTEVCHKPMNKVHNITYWDLLYPPLLSQKTCWNPSQENQKFTKSSILFLRTSTLLLTFTHFYNMLKLRFGQTTLHSSAAQCS